MYDVTICFQSSRFEWVKISMSKMKGSSQSNKHKLSGSGKAEVSLLSHHHSFQINKVKQKDKLNAWLCQHEPRFLLSKLKTLMITNVYQHPDEKITQKKEPKSLCLQKMFHFVLLYLIITRSWESLGYKILTEVQYIFKMVSKERLQVK